MGHIHDILPVVVNFSLPLDYDLFVTGKAQVLRGEVNDFEAIGPDVTILTCHIAGAVVYPYGNKEFPIDLLRAIEAKAIQNSVLLRAEKE